MAITKAERQALMDELRAEFAAQQTVPQAQIPDQPTTPELGIADVMRVLVMHSRISSTTLMDQCLSAIDREFAEAEPADVEEAEVVTV